MTFKIDHALLCSFPLLLSKTIPKRRTSYSTLQGRELEIAFWSCEWVWWKDLASLSRAISLELLLPALHTISSRKATKRYSVDAKCPSQSQRSQQTRSNRCSRKPHRFIQWQLKHSNFSLVSYKDVRIQARQLYKDTHPHALRDITTSKHQRFHARFKHRHSLSTRTAQPVCKVSARTIKQRESTVTEFISRYQRAFIRILTSIFSTLMKQWMNFIQLLSLEAEVKLQNCCWKMLA